MSSALPVAIAMLSSADPGERSAAARDIYRVGRALADEATRGWHAEPEFAALLAGFDPDGPRCNVGLAVNPITFEAIRDANGSPRLADVPPDQDAREFELHFDGDFALDILTTRDPNAHGAIARYLSKFGEGIQQIEYRVRDIDAATLLLKNKFGVEAIYPHSRSGADHTRVNFFLVPTPDRNKVLIELYEK